MGEGPASVLAYIVLLFVRVHRQAPLGASVALCSIAFGLLRLGKCLESFGNVTDAALQLDGWCSCARHALDLVASGLAFILNLVARVGQLLVREGLVTLVLVAPVAPEPTRWSASLR